ncbi:MAG: sulfotransferase [Bacteroidota bacterium]
MIFFFGCSRTASKAYQHILNQHTDIHISRELHLISSPRKKSLYLVYLKYRWRHRSLPKLCAELATLRSSTYWRTKQYDAGLFLEYLKENDIQTIGFKTLVRALMDFDAQKNGKAILGAKFPAHIFFFPVFRYLWGFKNGKYIFLARKPRDIVFSQFNKHEMRNPLLRISMVLYVAFMFDFTIFYSKFFSKKNVHFIKYEDFKVNREKVVQDLCVFTGQQYHSGMIQVKVFDSLIRKDTTAYQLSGFENVLLQIATFPWSNLYAKH